MKTEFLTMSTKGQVIIPANLREDMKLTHGTKFAIQRDGFCLVLWPITEEFLDSLCGSTKGLGDLRERMHRDDDRSR
jgi:bifunctional DNA-binding transcriptional regulator/antitoxin component of YhaV-PrlF toxin-antitoxin module